MISRGDLRNHIAEYEALKINELNFAIKQAIEESNGDAAQAKQQSDMLRESEEKNGFVTSLTYIEQLKKFYQTLPQNDNYVLSSFDLRELENRVLSISYVAENHPAYQLFNSLKAKVAEAYNGVKAWVNVNLDKILLKMGTEFDKSIKDKLMPNPPSLFSSLKKPDLPLADYFARFKKFIDLSQIDFYITYLTTFIVMDRAQAVLHAERNNYSYNPFDIHRMFASCFLLAYKFLNDSYFNNAYVARIAGLPISDLNRLELALCVYMEVKAFVSPDIYELYENQLLVLMNREENADQPRSANNDGGAAAASSNQDKMQIEDKRPASVELLERMKDSSGKGEQLEVKRLGEKRKIASVVNTENAEVAAAVTAAAATVAAAVAAAATGVEDTVPSDEEMRSASADSVKSMSTSTEGEDAEKNDGKMAVELPPYAQSRLPIFSTHPKSADVQLEPQPKRQKVDPRPQ